MKLLDYSIQPLVPHLRSLIGHKNTEVLVNPTTATPTVARLIRKRYDEKKRQLAGILALSGSLSGAS